MKSLFIGLNTVDLQFLVDEYPPSNTKIKAEKNGIYAGGPATNAAITFSHLGGQADLLTLIGKHAFTDFIYEDLKKQRVGIIDLISEKQTTPTFASVITAKGNGDRTVFSYHPDEHDSKLYDRILENLEMKSYDIIMVDGFYNPVALKLAERAKNYNIPVVLDGGSWKDNMEVILKVIDMVVCSEHYFPPGTNSTQDVIAYLTGEKISKIAVTRGSSPIVYRENGKMHEIPVPEIRAIDTLGAGDVFHGAFCYYYIKERNFAEALHKATIVAAESCKYFGTREWLHQSNSFK